MTLYRISNLKKVYGNRTVLNIPGLDIEANRICALLGPNGAGKSTLLNILGFLEAATSGSIQYRSNPVRYGESELQRLRKTVVLVDQHPILFTTSVYQNVAFGLKIRGFSKKDRRRIIDETLELVGMRSFADEPAHRLSGGETQRVALARALALSPDVFLCDEPTSSVDVENQDIVVNLLRWINEDKKINVIFTTHDRAQAASLAHRILVLDHGRLVPTTYENVFSGRVEKEGRSAYRFIVRNGFSVEIPEDQIRQNPGITRIFVDPLKIGIAEIEDNDPQKNRITGKVVSVSAENKQIRLMVDAGVAITLLISLPDYRKIKISVGDPVGLIVAPEAIRVM